MSLLDIGDQFTEAGLRKLKEGQVLVFMFEGSRLEFKIVHLNRKSGKVLVVPVTLYKPDEVAIIDKEPK